MPPPEAGLLEALRALWELLVMVGRFFLWLFNIGR
ncbi:hypothetical protein ABIC63_005441 [Pseudacidovorax sp. 1753]